MIENLRDAFGVVNLVFFLSLLVGFTFGWLAERSDFCIRASIVSLLDGQIAGTNRNSQNILMLLIAIITAFLGVQIANFYELLDYSNSLHGRVDVNVVAVFIGSTIFGVGMWLSRGCMSRLVVLSGRGNVRAFIALFFTAFVALSTLTGILSKPRLLISQLALPDQINHALLSLGDFFVPIASVFFVYMLIRQRRVLSISKLSLAICIGLLVPLCFYITSVIGADDFEPVEVEGLVFTSSVASTLSYLAYSTALTPKFGMGLVLGGLLGSCLSSLFARRAKLEGFQNAPHPLRYIAGAMLMGFGGVVAGGCTFGWLLTGSSVGNGGALIAITGFFAGTYVISKISVLLFGWGQHSNKSLSEA